MVQDFILVEPSKTGQSESAPYVPLNNLLEEAHNQNLAVVSPSRGKNDHFGRRRSRDTDQKETNEVEEKGQGCEKWRKYEKT